LIAFGSNLGLTVDLARVPQPGGLRSDQLLFSESCGRLLVTVSPSQQSAFEKVFENLPHALVGQVTTEPDLVILGLDGKRLLAEPVAALKESWRQ